MFIACQRCGRLTHTYYNHVDRCPICREADSVTFWKHVGDFLSHPLRFGGQWSVRLEWKLEDLWVGLFWRKTPRATRCLGLPAPLLAFSHRA